MRPADPIDVKTSGYCSAGNKQKIGPSYPIMTKCSTWTALRNPVFRQLWIASVISGTCVAAHALVTDRVKGKELYMPMNSAESPVNLLTSSHTDRVTHTPAYK